MKLSFKFLSITLAVAAVCLGVAFMLAYGAITSGIRQQLEAQQLENARQSMDKIDRLLFERQIDIQALAQQQQVQQFVAGRVTTATAAQAVSNLNTFKSYAADWSDLGILDLKGTVIASTNSQALTPGLLHDYPQLQAAYDQARQGKVAYSDVFSSRSGHHPLMIYMAPVRQGNTIVGVVGGNLAWSSVEDAVRSISGATANLVNRDGLMIASNQSGSDGDVFVKDYSATAAFRHARQKPADSALLPALDTPKQQSVNSHTTEQGHASFTGHGWVLMLDTLTNVAFAPALTLALSIFGIVLVVVLIGIVGIYFFINRSFMSPVRMLSAAVNRVALGDLTQTVSINSSDELGVLGRNFNEMTYQLADTHRGLETASRAAKEERAQLESSINSLRQGFILTNASGAMTIMNDSARKMFGMGRIEPSKTSLDIIAKALPEGMGLIDHVHKTLFKHKPSKFSNLPVKNRFVNLYLTPVLNENSPIGCVLLFEDVTEERILQRSRDEFFSIASHELRTPLTAIRGNAALIQQYYASVLKDKDLHEMVDDIHLSSTRLIEIVNDFLDASRLEQGKMKLELMEFNVEPIIEKVIYELGGMSRDKKIYLRFEHAMGSLPQVYADPNRVKQIVYNLLGNAMKFTEKGGITVQAEVSHNMLKVLVTDTGRGISPEGQQLLFHKFQQTGASLITRDTTRGTGLGLYISKLLTELMGGRVKLESSEVGKGSVFSFTLPVASKVKKTGAETPGKPSSSPAPKAQP